MRFYVDPGKVAYRVTDGEAVLIQTDTSYYYCLNAVGTYIWELLAAGHRTANELAAAVSQEFGQPQSVVEPDVRLLLADLKKEGLIAEE